MPPFLRISVQPEVNFQELREIMGSFMDSHEKVHLVLSDGIILTKESMGNLHERIAVQRILNPHQLKSILMEDDDEPHVILLRSEIIESWKPSDIESLYDILKIKSYGRGCWISVNIVGSGGVYENYLGRPYNKNIREEEDDEMGRTTPAARQSIDSLLEKYREMEKAMRKPDRELMEKLLLYGRMHTPEICSSSMDYSDSFLISIILELFKILERRKDEIGDTG